MFFLAALGQNITHVGNEWVGFGCFYSVGLILLVKIVNNRLGKLEWQWRMLLVVMVFCAIFGATAPSADGYLSRLRQREGILGVWGLR